jgi:tetratricopeptide (TPR) repeat protein
MPWAIQTFLHLSDNQKRKRHRTQDLKPWIVIGGWLIGLIICNGCTTTTANKWNQAADNVPPYHQLGTVPFFPQEEYQCGPASLAMALAWSGLRIDADELAPQVYTPSLKGSLQPAMIAAARRHGRVAYPISGANALLKEIAAGHPVIVLQNLGLSWVPVWHYAVVIGYDLDKAMIILHSGITNQKATALGTFENTWARSKHWGLLVLPPSRLPATAEENSYVKAIVGLERARQWPAAVEGYKTALGRWPQSLAAHIGLSNSYYAQGDLESARKVLQKTTVDFPGEGAAFNNLAHVLWKQGKKQEAIKAARRALRLGGPHVEKYQKTLQEIQSDEPNTSD